MMTGVPAYVPLHAPKFEPVAMESDPEDEVFPLTPWYVHPGARSFEIAVWVAVRSPLDATIRMTVCADATLKVVIAIAPIASSCRIFIEVNWVKGSERVDADLRIHSRSAATNARDCGASDD